MKNTEYKKNNSVWVLYNSDMNNYKLPVEAKLLKITNKKDGRFEVLIGTTKIKVNHIYDKESCYETAIFALKTALNTLEVIKTIYENSGSNVEFMNTLEGEFNRIKTNLLEICPEYN